MLLDVELEERLVKAQSILHHVSRPVALMERSASKSGDALINYGMYIFNMLTIMFANCYMGQCLQDEALKLCDAFYERDWADLPLPYQRALIICIIHAQTQKCEIKAGKFYKFSLSAYTNILKSVMGFYSMLRATT
ncbi:odorant receptor 33b-like [Fopius arisanus]|uniref:Odorant receptor 33b-like n=1 Tax=Fopius arisanus TaxID=64838 RepID=A0A9R1TMX1_9HYME|nr:PREDICTED: odorant receptor 33b-like [Fopius arisanus]